MEFSRAQTHKSPSWPPSTTATRGRAAHFHRPQSTPPCQSPSAKPLNSPNAATSAAGKAASASSRLSHRADLAPFSKSLAPPTTPPPNLPAAAQAATFAAPKSFGLAASAFSFRPQRASSSALAQRLRQRHGVFSQKHCWRRYSAFKPPTLPHGEAVSAERWVGPNPKPKRTHLKAN